MTSTEILDQLKALGLDSIKKVLLKHGIKEPLYGVKIEELKKIQKKIKNGHQLSLELYDSGIYDAMYLAGLIAEPEKMSKDELQHWCRTATSASICEYTVAWVASESRYGMELAMEWIKSDIENIASSGWATLSSIVAITDDKKLDMNLLKELMDTIPDTIHSSKNRIKAAKNLFLISVGTYVKELNSYAKELGLKIGKVNVDVGETACKVPYAIDYIEKAEGKNIVGKKRKSARC